MKNIIISVIIILGILNAKSNETMNSYSNKTNNNKMLLVLFAPSIKDSYYKSAFNEIVNFQINYAKAILENDNVIVVVNKDTKPFYDKSLPEDILLVDEILDIWARDFSTINPINPIKFTYSWASMSKKESIQVQNSFKDFAEKYKLKFNQTDLILDGGNIVDNYNDKVITTTRFLSDNDLTYKKGKKVLQKTLNANEVAIIEPDEEVLAHSDGMVMWLDDYTLLVNDYSKIDKELYNLVMDELSHSFPNTKIIKVPVRFNENSNQKWSGFNQACGVNLNSVLTYENIYVPTFNMSHEKSALEIIKKNSSKKIIEIDAKGVCEMGGSVRCLTWQLTGENATKLMEAARK